MNSEEFSFMYIISINIYSISTFLNKNFKYSCFNALKMTLNKMQAKMNYILSFKNNYAF